MTTKTFKATIVQDGIACFVPVPFDPKDVFGRTRVPVTVTLNGYTYRSTIARMGEQTCVPLRKSNREAAGLRGGETLSVTLALDMEERSVELPATLEKALSADAREKWDRLSFTRKREYAEAVATAKKPETQERRIGAIVRALS